MKTKREWKRFENYCQEQTNGTFQVKNVPADIVDKLLELGKFFKDVRKRDEAEYGPASISSFQRSIQHRLKGNNLEKQGQGNKPNASFTKVF